MTSSHVNRSRRWKTLDITIGRFAPGIYSAEQIRKVFNEDLNYPKRSTVDNLTLGLLLRGKDSVRCLGHGKWEVLPRSQETPAAKEGAPA